MLNDVYIPMLDEVEKAREHRNKMRHISILGVKRDILLGKISE